MTAAAPVVDQELLRRFGLHKCETHECQHPPCSPHAAVLSQSKGGTIEAVAWECLCGWSRTIPKSWKPK